MSAFHEALQAVIRETPNITYSIHCVTGPPPWCQTEFSETDMEEPGFWTKFAFIKLARAKGWTWDEDGNWLCPKCNKKGGEE